MNHVRKILVPTDFSPASSEAFSYAIWFADQLEATIDVIHVVYPGTDVMDFPAVSAQTTKIQIETAEQVMKAFTEEALTRVQSTTDLQHVPVVRSFIEVGSPVSLIAGSAKDLDSDLIIIGTRGKHNRLEAAFGSVTAGVLAHASVPVLVVPEDLKVLRARTVGYATSLEESDPFHIWQAIQLMQPFNPIVKIVHVHTGEDQDKKIDLEAIQSFFAGKNLALQLSVYESHDPDVESGLEGFIEVEKIELLIMYSPKRNLFERIGHRSITKKMALYSHVPLLVMK